jgi:hypothetical protein
VPAVVVASAAPAMAASPCLTASFGGNSCKWPGSTRNFGYKLEICFTNTCATAVTVTVDTVQANTGQAPLVQVNQTITVPAGQKVCLPTMVIYCSTSSANFINVTWHVTGQAAQVSQLPSPVQDCVGDSQCSDPA